MWRVLGRLSACHHALPALWPLVLQVVLAQCTQRGAAERQQRGAWCHRVGGFMQCLRWQNDPDQSCLWQQTMNLTCLDAECNVRVDAYTWRTMGSKQVRQHAQSMPHHCHSTLMLCVTFAVLQEVAAYNRCKVAALVQARPNMRFCPGNDCKAYVRTKAYPNCITTLTHSPSLPFPCAVL